MRPIAIPLLWTLSVVVAGPAHAQPTLTATEQEQLAIAFAPTLTFHQLEQFFPCSPLLDLQRLQADGTVVDADGDGGSIGSIRSRIGLYAALSLERKMQAARVAYRVRGEAAGPVVIEYWLYYVNDTYRVRGGLVPYRVDGSHPNDLEHISVSLMPTAVPPDVPWSPRHYSVVAVLGSAHGGAISGNRYDVSRGRAASLPLSFLVELGSHAMAPDIDHDDRFTRAGDSNGGKFVWGIRDHGDTWSWYLASYADARDPKRAVRLYPRPGDSAFDDGPERCGHFELCFPYRLEAADQIEARFQTLGLTDDLLAGVLGHTPWLRRSFGGIDSTKLLLPSMRGGPSEPDGSDRAVSGDASLLVGFTNILSSITSFLGVEYKVTTRPAIVPDFLFDAVALVTSDGHRFHEETALASYPLDAIADLVVGGTLRGDTLSLRHGGKDVFAGVEFRLNRWRVRTIARNPYKGAWIDFRVYYLLW